MLARRSLQVLLDRSAAYLSPKQIDKFVTHLNRNNRDSIEAEWELIVLAALASIGVVQHEPTLGGTSRLDVRFSSARLRFVSDVRVVSDEAYHRENPVDQLSDAVRRYTEKLRNEGIEGGLDFMVDGIGPNLKRGRYKTRLILPRVHEFARFIFDERFDRFLDSIRREPSETHSYSVSCAHAAVSFTFMPGNSGIRRCSYPVFDLPHDVRHNVVCQALRDKSRQIKNAGRRADGEFAGVILCDGGCAMLRASPGINTVSIDRVVQAFLRKSRTIDFVFVIDAYQPLSRLFRHLRFEARAWSLRYPDLIDGCRRELNTALQALPAPVRSAVNTVNHFKWSEGSLHRLYSDYIRSSSMTQNSIELSLRASMDYLAGRIDRAEFERVVPPDWLKYLQQNLTEGIGVAAVSIARHPGEDDDGLVLVFGDRDPAMSPYRRTV